MMAGQLRGHRPWAGTRTLQSDDTDQHAPRQDVAYSCPHGHTVTVPLALEIEIPPTWQCPAHGIDSPRTLNPTPPSTPKPPRTHWDMLLERRSIPELERLLAERLKELRGNSDEP
jgi:hypothetical protein